MQILPFKPGQLGLLQDFYSIFWVLSGNMYVFCNQRQIGPAGREIRKIVKILLSERSDPDPVQIPTTEFKTPQQ